MIIDLPRFIAEEQPYWRELDGLLEGFERDSARRPTLEEARRLYYLYQRAATGLSRLTTYAAEQHVRGYLEALVARAYGEIHETRKRAINVRLREWFGRTLPQTFRRRRSAFVLATVITLAGSLFGAGVIYFDYDAKSILMPFPHLLGAPSERVAWEEGAEEDRMAGSKSTFSAMLMTNNIRVSITAMALGMTFGVGTVVVLFFNGVILGAVACDYILDGQTVFLLGWLLPHGSVEIPAILLGGQCGLIIAGAMIGWGSAQSMAVRFRRVTPDVVTLVFGLALLLVWAGIVESFVSQYHQPVLVYGLKIAFGMTQLVLLFLYLEFAGRGKQLVVRS